MKQIFQKTVFLLIMLCFLQSCSDEDIREAAIQVTTQDFSDIKMNTAVGSGYITVDEDSRIIKRGICWSTSPDPTTDDEAAQPADDTLLGGFTVQLFGLTPSTLYYAKAYASDGTKTYYGNEMTFITRDTPSGGWCLIDKISEITPNGAHITMEIADDGGNEIIEYGISYNETGIPTDGDDKIVSDPGGFKFEAILSGLSQDTKYYATPYFMTPNGKIYGETVAFRTLNFIRTVDAFPGYQAAYLLGEVIMDAGSPTSEKGICWSSSPLPTLDDSYEISGSGSGAFTVLVGGLTKGTTYYMRAYAKNEDGIFYGLEKQFITKTGDILPGANISDLILVQKGTFGMGEPNTENIPSNISGVGTGKEPVHQVKFTRDFYINKFETTNEQICTFLNVYQSTTRRFDIPGQAIYNSSGRTFSFKVSGTSPNLVYAPVNAAASRKPAANITWGCASEYVKWLSAELGVTVNLPTEAQWEYAARGGNQSLGYYYSGSNTLSDVGVFTNTSTGPSAVGSKAPNELGIYDMSGNVFEYCLDNYNRDFYLSQVGQVTEDPFMRNTPNGAKIIRGGSFRHNLYQRTSSRGNAGNESDCGTHSGMRIIVYQLPTGL